MAKIIHAADIHLGASFSYLPPEQAEQARQAQWQALADLAQFAGERHADAVLLAGDLFDDPYASGELGRKAMGILGKCPCPVFISPGNHDFYHSGSVYAASYVPKNVHVFKSREMQGVPLADGQTVVYGAAFEEDSAYLAMAENLDPDKVNLCCIHGDLLRPDSGYNPIQPQEISDSGFTYIAAGHNHQSSGLRKAGRTYYACPGSFCALTAREEGRRGYLFGQITQDDIKMTFVPCKTIRLIGLEVDVSDIFSDSALQEKITIQMPEERERTCLRLTLSGTKNYEIGLSALERALKRAFFHCVLRDETQEPSNLWEGLQENDLRGAVLRRMRAELKHAQGEEREKILRAAQYLQSAMN